MKKLLRITVLLLIAVVLIPACSKEDNNGNEEEKTPTASFTVLNDSIFVNDTVYFTNTSTDAGSYLWDFGDEQTSTETSPSHSYSAPGNYTVSLTVYSPHRSKNDKVTKIIKVSYSDFVASFNVSSSVFVNKNVHFTNTSTNAGSYLWDFGDGKTSTNTSPNHTYTASGTYTVTLTAYSLDGTKSDEANASIKVYELLPPLTIQVNGVSFTMICVEGGTFGMGAQSNDPNGQNYDPDAWNGDGPVHQVTLSSYYIGEFEVTQELWEAVMGNNPSRFIGHSNPVECVSWNMIVNDFLPVLNSLTGRTFALPTEAQWEFAARGGNGSQHYKYSGSNNIEDVAWYRDNNSGKTHPVGQKQANELGIYDMSGNVCEWCSDWYEYDYYQNSPSVNPQGPSTGFNNVLRGGCWYYCAYSCRASFRSYSDPDTSTSTYGFRLVLIP